MCIVCTVRLTFCCFVLMLLISVFPALRLPLQASPCLSRTSSSRSFSKTTLMSLWSTTISSPSPAMKRNVPYRSIRFSMKNLSVKLPDVHIPVEKLDFNFARSSGPGGQNVNKLNTKAEMRFNVDDADWIPDEVKARLKESQEKNINKMGELYVSSQEHRTQKQNKLDCVEKLREMVAFAYLEPKERKMYEGLSAKGKAIRRDEKKKRGQVKQSRQKNKKFDYD